MQPHPRSPVATALSPLWVFLRATEEDGAPVTSASSLPCLQSEIKVLTHFCKTEPRLGVTAEWRGGGQGAACFFSSEGGYQRCEHCETTLCLPPKQVLIWGAFDCDHGSICIRSSWEERRTCHISPTRVCSHQEQGRRNSGLCRHQKWQLS